MVWGGGGESEIAGREVERGVMRKEREKKREDFIQEKRFDYT